MALFERTRRTAFAVSFASFIAAIGVPASGAVRDLPDVYTPGVTVPVLITVDAPPGATVAAMEDAPPPGWVVSIISISDSGSFDAQTGKVKWGLFFAPSIPSILSYNVAPPANAPAPACFVGTVSFGGADTPMAGDSCITVAIPALSGWGLAVTGALLLTSATLVLRRGRNHETRRMIPGAAPVSRWP